MTPASKGTPAKKVPASRPVAKKTASATKKIVRSKAAPVAKKRPTPTKKAASVVKKAAPTAKKAAPPAKKAVGVKKSAPVTKKAAVAPKKAPRAATAKKAAPPAKKAAAAGKKAAPVKTVVVAAPAPARTTFTPRPKPPAPIKPKTGPYAKDTKFLEEVTELLIADRAIYQEQATSLRAEADSLALEREPGDVQFDEESGEGGTVTVDRERNLALSGQAALAVEEIDYALERIADKTYGYCERCFQPIPKPRLRALPYARLCVACKSGGLSRR
jgi:RNA polymerase-binding transcription factor DksA